MYLCNDHRKCEQYPKNLLLAQVTSHIVLCAREGEQSDGHTPAQVQPCRKQMTARFKVLSVGKATASRGERSRRPTAPPSSRSGGSSLECGAEMQLHGPSWQLICCLSKVAAGIRKISIDTNQVGTVEKIKEFSPGFQL